RRAERERLRPAVELRRMKHDVDPCARTEARHVVTKREGRPSFDAKLDEHDVDPLGAGELHRFFDRSDLDVMVTLVTDDVLDRLFCDLVVDEDKHPNRRCSTEAHRAITPE